MYHCVLVKRRLGASAADRGDDGLRHLLDRGAAAEIMGHHLLFCRDRLGRVHQRSPAIMPGRAG